MEKLLNVVDNTLFEVSRIISEQADPRGRFVDRRFMTRSDSLEDVMYQKPAYPIDFDVGNRPVLFPTPSGYLARPAIRDTVADHDVAPAEELTADDTSTTQVCQCQEISAPGTQNGGVTLPHG